MAKQRAASDDDSSPLFFLLALLVCAVLPWTLMVLWELLLPGRREVAKVFPSCTEDGLRVRQCQTQVMSSKREARLRELRSRLRLCTSGFLVRAVILGLLWCWLAYIVVQVRQVLATSARYQNFDPHQILGVSGNSGTADLKKAFRRLSLKYHPDKNPDPAAPEQFMLVKKAYDALTDPIAKRNYAMYGNPDGPSRVELSVALPSFSKENQGLVLVLFVLLFVIGVPLTLLWCMGSSSSDKCPNGVLFTTMEALMKRIKDLADVRKAQEFLLESGESGACLQRPGEDQALAVLLAQLQGSGGGKAASKKANSNVAPQKAEALLLAHTQRRRELLSPALAEDLDVLLGSWRIVALAMAEVAAKLGQAEPLEAALELHRCIVQALEPNALGSGGTGPLLQVPHFTTERIKLWRKGPRKSAGLPAFLELPTEERRAGLNSLGLSQQQLIDVEEFAATAPHVAITDAKVFVDGEDSICQGDLATLQVTFTRANLRKGEAAGAVHAPLFPGVEVPEAWWLCFMHPGGKAGRTARCARVLQPGREVVVEMKFKVATVGKNRCTVSLMCEAYAGVDAEQGLTFESKPAPADADEDEEGEESDDGED